MRVDSQEPPPPIAQGQPRKVHTESSTNSNIETEDSNNRAQNPMLKTRQNIEANKTNATAKHGYEKNSDSQFSAINDDPIATYTFWLMLFTGLLALCNVVLCFFNIMLWRTTARNVELGRKEFIATHQPRLRVHSICLKKADSTPKLIGGSYITHQLHYSVDNIGGSAATIIKQSLTFKRLNEPLPVPSYCDPLLVEKTIACGESISDSFGVEHFLISLNEERGVDDLYFFGYIDYLDDVGTTRRTAFCRRYIQETKRFTKVKDEDYEYSY